jgi:hypothetical protein
MLTLEMAPSRLAGTILVVGAPSLERARVARALEPLADTVTAAPADAADPLVRLPDLRVVVAADAGTRAAEVLGAAAALRPEATRILVQTDEAIDAAAPGVTVVPPGAGDAALRAVGVLALRCAAAEGEARRLEAERAHADAPDGAEPRAAWTIAVPPTGASLATLEREIFERTLSLAGRNQSRAARILGLPESTFRFRLQKLGIASRRRAMAATALAANGR